MGPLWINQRIRNFHFRLIINESLSRGTQLDYIKRGLANGWGIVVLNYNEKCMGTEEKVRQCRWLCSTNLKYETVSIMQTLKKVDSYSNQRRWLK